MSKINSQEVLRNKQIQDATLSWERHTVPTGANGVVELDAYGVYAIEASVDTYIMECESAAAAGSESLDGYGLRVRADADPTVIVGQWGYADAFHLATRAVGGSAGILRALKVGRLKP